MNKIVVYKSKTGFTKQYAEWIAEDLCCEAVPLESVNADKLAAYEQIIFGGWIMGNMINGLEDIKKMNPTNLILFAVGFSKIGECEENIIETNHLEQLPLFYMEGGYHPKKMGFMFKTMVKAVTKKPVEETDHTDRKYIEPLITYVKEKEV